MLSFRVQRAFPSHPKWTSTGSLSSDIESKQNTNNESLDNENYAKLKLHWKWNCKINSLLRISPSFIWVLKNLSKLFIEFIAVFTSIFSFIFTSDAYICSYNYWCLWALSHSRPDRHHFGCLRHQKVRLTCSFCIFAHFVLPSDYHFECCIQEVCNMIGGSSIFTWLIYPKMDTLHFQIKSFV